MARLIIRDYVQWGDKLRTIVGSDVEKAAFLKDPVAVLKNYMEPAYGLQWSDLTIHIHEDKQKVVNIALPFRGDVEYSESQLDPATSGNVPYSYPGYCTLGNASYLPPDGGATDAETKAVRLKAYRTRLGDYIMTRCK